MRTPDTNGRMVVGSAALGRALAAAVPGEPYVALLMPNAIASVVAFMGMQAVGVVPCLLNVSAGAAAMLSACRAAGVRSVVSSRTFVEKARLAMANGDTFVLASEGGGIAFPKANVLWAKIDREVTDQAPMATMFTPKHLDFVSKRVGNFVFSKQFYWLVDQSWVQ